LGEKEIFQSLTIKCKHRHTHTQSLNAARANWRVNNTALERARRGIFGRRGERDGEWNQSFAAKLFLVVGFALHVGMGTVGVWGTWRPNVKFKNCACLCLGTCECMGACGRPAKCSRKVIILA